MKLIAIVPVYNHDPSTVVAALRALALPVLLVDDGSDPATAALLDQLAQTPTVELLRHAQNQGKGGAVMNGLRHVAEQGYSHALQIDADGQHDTSALPAFLSTAAAQPAAVISGYPLYDASVPKGRLYSRYATHVWVWINTLSLRIRDSMCGVRIYPLAATLPLLDAMPHSLRMEFDTEILVRLDWAGTPIVNLPVPVHYPADGRSHFQPLHDNLRISWMHTRLFFGMLRRLPMLLSRRAPTPAQPEPDTAAGIPDSQPTSPMPNPPARQWAQMGEAGCLAGIRFLLWVYRTFGRWPFRVVLAPVMLWFFLRRRAARQASDDYLRRLYLFSEGKTPPPGAWNSLRHFMVFADTVLNKLLAAGNQPLDTPALIDGAEAIEQLHQQQRGGVFVSAHLGNVELCRMLSKHNLGLRMTVLAHTHHATRFNSLMQELDPSREIDVVQVTDFSIATAILLSQRVEQGGFIVMSGDREPPTPTSQAVTLPFLGAPASFPCSPYILAGMLDCPLFAVFGTRREDGFHVTIRRLAEQINLPRRDRAAAIRPYAEAFVRLMEDECLAAPLQWGNFYDFWQEPPAS